MAAYDRELTQLGLKIQTIRIPRIEAAVRLGGKLLHAGARRPLIKTLITTPDGPTTLPVTRPKRERGVVEVMQLRKGIADVLLSKVFLAPCQDCYFRPALPD